MDALLRRVLPVKQSRVENENYNYNDDDDDGDNVYSADYSFAIQYKGPPIPYDVPRAVPVEIDLIPTASKLSSSFVINGVSLPVIQPIVKSKPRSKKPPKESRVSSEIVSSDESVKDYDVSFKFKGYDYVHESLSPSFVQKDDSGGGNGEECDPKLSDDRLESLCNFSFSDADEFPKSSEIVEIPNDDNHEPKVIEGFRKPIDFESSSSEENNDDDDDKTSGHVRRPSTVTFLEPRKLNDTVESDSDLSEFKSIVSVKPKKAQRNGKKGSCYRCLTGNRFTLKEVCFVCDAKYCYSCVLRAMGSMPEGRKCIMCIGNSIDESKRGSLGKCSRLLKRLVTEVEVEQIMKLEISCKANQLPSQLIYVNNDAINDEQLHLLQTCVNPPRNLKPGYFWYDKVSGLWGKEGQKPCQFICPDLNVGSSLRTDASNGNTGILMNNREITKVELVVMQLAGVECEGKPHLWVSANGSYQEEGQNHVKGNLWEKTIVKIASSLLSLPIPPNTANEPAEEVNGRGTYPEQQTVTQLLLVGFEKAGTSCIYKQAKLLYNVPFSEDERESSKLLIRKNLYTYLGILLEGRERFEEEIRTKGKFVDQSSHSDSGSTGEIVDNKTVYSIGQRLKVFADWLLDVIASGNFEAIFPAAHRAYAPLVEDLWKDAAIQATFDRIDELEMIPWIANYFLERAVEISRTNYEPSDKDILLAEGIASSSGLSCMEFSFPKLSEESSVDPIYQPDPSTRYQLIRVHSRNLGGNCKWLEMFEDVDIVLFCVSLSSYDEVIKDNNNINTNKMLATKHLFETIITHPNFINKKFLLILNKFDLLEQKISRVPLKKCEWFHDFNPVISHNPCGSSSSNRNNDASLAQRAFHYIAVKFKRLFDSVTDSVIVPNYKCNYNRKLFVSRVTGLDPDSVDKALKYVREIMSWQVEESSFFQENSMTSVEASTHDVADLR